MGGLGEGFCPTQPQWFYGEFEHLKDILAWYEKVHRNLDCPVYFNFLYKQNVNFFLWFTTSRISQFIKEGKKYIVSAVC